MYKMNSIAYKELMRRCRGSIDAAKMEILRGLSLPQSFKEISKLDKKTNKIKEVYFQTKYVDELIEIIVVN